MNLYVLAFLIGIVSGLRAFMGLAATSWAARLHWLHLEDTKLAFFGYAATPYILSFLALGELVCESYSRRWDQRLGHIRRSRRNVVVVEVHQRRRGSTPEEELARK